MNDWNLTSTLKRNWDNKNKQRIKKLDHKAKGNKKLDKYVNTHNSSVHE